MIMTNTIKTILLALTLVSYAFAGITDGKFGSAQIFDVQYNWSGNTLSVSNLIAPYDSNFQHPTVANGDYFQFFNSTTVAGTYGLALYQSDGTLKQVLHDTGTFSALSNNVIFYVGSGFYGTIITPGEGYNYGDSDSFTVANQNPTANDLSGYTWSSLTPLAAGQTAAPTLVSSVVTNTVTTASTPNGAATSTTARVTRVVNTTDADGNPVATTYEDATTTTTQPVTVTTTTTPVTTETYSDGSTNVVPGTPVVTTASSSEVTVAPVVTTTLSTAVTAPVVTTSITNGTPTTATTTALRNVSSTDADGNAVVETYNDVTTTTTTPRATTTTTVPVTTTTLADGTVTTSNGTATSATVVTNVSTSATTSTLYKTAVTTQQTSSSVENGAAVTAVTFTLRPVAGTDVNGNAVVTTYKDTVTTTTTPVATTTTAYPVTTTTFADGTITVTNDAPVVTTTVANQSTSATTSALYSTAVTTQETVTSVERGTAVTGSTFTLRSVNGELTAGGNPVVTTYKDTVTTSTVPVATTTTTVAVTTTTYADGSATTITRGAPVTATVVTREVTTANTSTLYSTAVTAPKVTTATATGTAIVTVAAVKGNSTSTPVSVLTSDKTKEKVIEVTRTTTTTTTTPVATTTTTTTPVTTITTTTPETTTTYAETNEVVVTYGTPVVTSTTSNVVTTNTVNTTESATAVADTKFTTRIDQFSSLVDANKRLNARLKANPLDRHFNATPLPGITSFINIETGKTNTVDTNVIERQNVTIGGEYFVTYNALIGLNYNYATLKLDGLNAAGDLKKHQLGLYGLFLLNDWLLEAEVAGALNTFNNAHSLPELNLLNTGTTKGTDFWVNVRGYTQNFSGLRAFVGGRFESNSTDAFVESGSALTAASYAANKLSDGTAEGGLRFDNYISTNARVIAEAGINTDQLITGKIGLNIKNTPDTFSGTIGFVHQKLDDLTDNGARAELNFKF